MGRFLRDVPVLVDCRPRSVALAVASSPRCAVGGACVTLPSAAMRRLVVVARDFPPAGGAPSIRVAKLAKYLPRFGWQALVITAPPDHAWVHDTSLLAELPRSLAVHRIPRLFARSLPPAEMASRAQPEVRAHFVQRLATLALVPDRSILWAIPALQAVRSLPFRPDAILTSAPPFSTHLVGLLTRGSEIPWVADYRDNWTTNPDYRGPWPLRGVNRMLERWTLARAQAVLAMSDAACAELASVLPSARGRILVAPNGYDPEDLPERSDWSDRPERFSLVYAGSIRSTRDPRPLFRALSRLIADDPSFAADVDFRMFGTIPDSVVSLAQGLLGSERTHMGGFIPHREALREASRSRARGDLVGI